MGEFITSGFEGETGAWPSGQKGSRAAMEHHRADLVILSLPPVVTGLRDTPGILPQQGNAQSNTCQRARRPPCRSGAVWQREHIVQGKQAGLGAGSGSAPPAPPPAGLYAKSPQGSGQVGRHHLGETPERGGQGRARLLPGAGPASRPPGKAFRPGKDRCHLLPGWTSAAHPPGTSPAASQRGGTGGKSQLSPRPALTPTSHR